MKWRDWWKRETLPETDMRPEVYQHAEVAGLYCRDAECDHPWETVTDFWWGKIADCNIWIYTDICRRCEALRVRRVAQGTEARIAAWRERIGHSVIPLEAGMWK